MLYVFASNVPAFIDAVNAQFDSGPLDNCFSTKSHQMERCSDFEAIKKLEKAYPDNSVFQSGCFRVYWHDDQGKQVE
jgi:hypothetical protein